MPALRVPSPRGLSIPDACGGTLICRASSAGETSRRSTSRQPCGGDGCIARKVLRAARVFVAQMLTAFCARGMLGSRAQLDRAWQTNAHDGRAAASVETGPTSEREPAGGE